MVKCSFNFLLRDTFGVEIYLSLHGDTFNLSLQSPNTSAVSSPNFSLILFISKLSVFCRSIYPNHFNFLKISFLYFSNNSLFILFLLFLLNYFDRLFFQKNQLCNYNFDRLLIPNLLTPCIPD